MISTRTFSTFNYIVSFGAFLRVLLFRWDSKSGRYVLCNPEQNKIDFYLFKFQPPVNIAVRLFAVTYCTIILLIGASNLSELTFGFIFIGISLMSIPVHIQYYLNAPVIVDFLNNLLVINKRAGI